MFYILIYIGRYRAFRTRFSVWRVVPVQGPEHQVNQSLPMSPLSVLVTYSIQIRINHLKTGGVSEFPTWCRARDVQTGLPMSTIKLTWQ